LQIALFVFGKFMITI